MKKVVVLACIVFLAVAAWLSATATVAHADGGSKPYVLEWCDNFDGPSLDSRWSWVREEPAFWSLSAAPGSLSITSSGGLYGPTNDQKNILVTDWVGGWPRITAHVNVAPTANNNGAAIYLYGDDDNYFEVGRTYANGSVASVHAEFSGVATTYTVPATATDLYLRMAVEGGVFAGYYSEDGVDWHQIGSIAYNVNFYGWKVGLGARMGPTATPVTAAFDWIQTESINYDLLWTDSFQGAAGTQWTWLREDKPLYSFTAEYGALSITSSGNLYGANNNQKNLLLAPAPIGDFRLEASVFLQPTANDQGGAIYVYQDDDNYIEVSKTYQNGNVVRIRQEVNGVGTTRVLTTTATGVVDLRIEKEGNAYTGQYSANYSPWRTIGSFTADLRAPKVGVGATMGTATPPVTVLFGQAEVWVGPPPVLPYKVRLPSVLGGAGSLAAR